MARFGLKLAKAFNVKHSMQINKLSNSMYMGLKYVTCNFLTRKINNNNKNGKDAPVIDVHQMFLPNQTTIVVKIYSNIIQFKHMQSDLLNYFVYYGF